MSLWLSIVYSPSDSEVHRSCRCWLTKNYRPRMQINFRGKGKSTETQLQSSGDGIRMIMQLWLRQSTINVMGHVSQIAPVL